MLAAMHRFADAIAPLERAAQSAGERDRDILDLLSAMYAENRRFDDAVSAAGKALQLATSAGDTRLAAELRARISAYEQELSRH